jgi:hypothetical protein
MEKRRSLGVQTPVLVLVLEHCRLIIYNFIQNCSSMYEELQVLQFAVSAIPEIKSEKEQFAPPLHTTTFEGFFSPRRAVQFRLLPHTA